MKASHTCTQACGDYSIISYMHAYTCTCVCTHALSERVKSTSCSISEHVIKCSSMLWEYIMYIKKINNLRTCAHIRRECSLKNPPRTLRTTWARSVILPNTTILPASSSKDLFHTTPSFRSGLFPTTLFRSPLYSPKQSKNYIEKTIRKPSRQTTWARKKSSQSMQ